MPDELKAILYDRFSEVIIPLRAALGIPPIDKMPGGVITDLGVIAKAIDEIARLKDEIADYRLALKSIAYMIPEAARDLARKTLEKHDA